MKLKRIILATLLSTALGSSLSIFAEEKKDQSFFDRAKHKARAWLVLNTVKNDVKTLVEDAKKLENDPKNMRDQSESNPLLRYWKNPKGLSNRYFLKIMQNAKKYEDLGILDKILDLYFKETETTPNSILDKCFSNGCDYSFFQIAANNAIFNENDRIVFEKLLQRHGDARLMTKSYGRETNTLDDIEATCKYFCNTTQSNEEENNKNKVYCNRSKMIFERLNKKQQ